MTDKIVQSVDPLREGDIPDSDEVGRTYPELWGYIYGFQVNDRCIVYVWNRILQRRF